MKRVMVFGTFDILHPGHIEFLRQAKKYGSFLVVSLARNNYIRKIKGHKPHHTEADRKKLLGAIKYVDKVVLGSKTDYIKHIVQENPDVIVLGYDQKYFTENLKNKLASAGLAKVEIVRAKPYRPNFHKSSKILKRL